MKTPYDKPSDVDFQNNLGFSLCATLSVYHMVATSENRNKI